MLNVLLRVDDCRGGGIAGLEALTEWAATHHGAIEAARAIYDATAVKREG